MIEESDEFNYETWLSSSPKPTLLNCVQSATNILAAGRGNLRSRLVAALFCMTYRAEDVPVPTDLREEVDAIRAAVTRRIGEEFSYRALRQSVLKIKLKSAVHLAERIVQLDRKLAARRGT